LPVVALLLEGATLCGEITFAPNGEVVIPAADFKRMEGGFTVTFEATRWGMYELKVDGGNGPLRMIVNGAGPFQRADGSLRGHYIEKSGPCTVEVSGETADISSLTLVPTWEGEPIVQKAGEAIVLDARDSKVEGVMLRYEPNPKKLCLGYWGNPDDTPHWEYTVVTPGAYEVILTQGCGSGGGGSEAVLETGGERLKFAVQDTGGYQNWVDRSLGTVTFKEAGVQSLRVRIVKKARGIMDIRRIVLKPVAK
jgi:hypothetical protein